jgi:hypothetical protein
VDRDRPFGDRYVEHAYISTCRVWGVGRADISIGFRYCFVAYPLNFNTIFNGACALLSVLRTQEYLWLRPHLQTDPSFRGVWLRW